MNNKIFLALFIGFVFMVSSFGMSNAASATVPHTSYTNAKALAWVPNAPYSCANQTDETNVTQILAIQAGSADTPITYNTTNLYADKGACVKFVLVDVVNLHHDFTLDKVVTTGNTDPTVQDADLTKAQINTIDMDTMNNTDDVGFGPGINVFYSWMPQVDAHFTYFCGQPGHRAQGMEGTLWVGAQPSSPGFDLAPLIVALLSVATVGFIFRKKNRN